MKTIGKAALLTMAFIVSLTGGCAQRLTIARPAASPSPATAPSPDMARVFFIRPNTENATSFNAVSVWEGDRLLAYLAGAEKAYVDLPPGQYVFLGIHERADVLEGQLAAGRTYFVQVTYHKFPMGESVHLEPLFPGHENWESLSRWIKFTRLVELIPEEAEIWSARNARLRAAYMRRYSVRPEESKKLISPEYGV